MLSATAWKWDTKMSYVQGCILVWTINLYFAQMYFDFTYWKKIGNISESADFNFFFFLPQALLFEGQSWQLVDLTFASCFKSSFHHKMKILLLAVTFRCGWMCHTVKKWKLDHRPALISTVIETGCSERCTSPVI